MIGKLFGPAVDHFSTINIEPPKPLSARQQISAADTQEMDYVAGRQAAPKQLAGRAVERENFLAIGRGHQDAAAIKNARIQIAIEIRRRIAAAGLLGAR